MFEPVEKGLIGARTKDRVARRATIPATRKETVAHFYVIALHEQYDQSADLIAAILGVEKIYVDWWRSRLLTTIEFAEIMERATRLTPTFDTWTQENAERISQLLGEHRVNPNTNAGDDTKSGAESHHATHCV